jgi:hypothetical protein
MTEQHARLRQAPIPVYRFHSTNHCPGCGRTHWHIGAMTAECAFCATPLLLEEGVRSSTIIKSRKGNGSWR